MSHANERIADSVPEFVSQRRRWLNGAFFAAIYSLVHFRQIWSTDHTLTRKILLHVEFVYQFLNLLFTFFSLANFYLTFYFVAGSLADPLVDPFGHGVGKWIFYLLRYICVLLICVQFILSMGNRPQGAKKLYVASMVVYSVIMVYTTFATVYIVVRQFMLKNSASANPEMVLGEGLLTNLAVSLASTVGLYFFSSIIYLDPWHMLTSSAQYFALLPSYICTLQIYAFCNTHDISWGTKGDNTISTDLGTAQSKGQGGTVELEMPSEQLDIDSGYDEALRNLRDRVETPGGGPDEATLQEDYYRAVRTYMVVCWMVANAVLAMAVSESFAGTAVGDNWYLSFLLWSVAAIALFRAVGSTAFRVIELVGKAVEGKAKWESGGWRGLRGGGSGGGSSRGGSTVVSSKVGVATGGVWAKVAGGVGGVRDKLLRR
jgi:chitin synthase